MILAKVPRIAPEVQEKKLQGFSNVHQLRQFGLEVCPQVNEQQPLHGRGDFQPGAPLQYASDRQDARPPSASVQRWATAASKIARTRRIVSELAPRTIPLTESLAEVNRESVETGATRLADRVRISPHSFSGRNDAFDPRHIYWLGLVCSALMTAKRRHR